MTVAVDKRVTSFDGNDVTTSFSIDFDFYELDDIVVKHVDSDDVITTLVYLTDYSISGIGLGEDVTYPITGSPLATGERLVVYRLSDYIQDLDLVNNEGQHLSMMEQGLDAVVLTVQELKEDITRCIQKDIASDETVPGFDDYLATMDAKIVLCQDEVVLCEAQVVLATDQAVLSAASAVDSAASALEAQNIVNALNIDAKAHVRCITTSNITLSGLQTIDGYTTSADDRVCVNAQTDSADNGIYIAASGAWLRSADMDEPDEAILANFYVQYGTVYAGTQWRQTGNVSVIGTDPINFVLISGGGAAIEIQASETAHGFSVGQPIRWDGTNYVLAQADSDANAEVDGLVSEVLGVNTFKFAPVGGLDLADWSGATYGASATLVSGKLYYLDPDTGGVIISEDDVALTDGEVDKPIGKALSTTQMNVYGYRGVALSDDYSGRTSISSSALSSGSGVFEWTHNLGSSSPVTAVYDSNGELVIPDVDVVSSDRIDLDFGSSYADLDTPLSAVAVVAGANVTYNISSDTPVASSESGSSGDGSGDAQEAGHKHPAQPMIIWRLVNDVVDDAEPLGSGGSDWEVANTVKNEEVLGNVNSVTESSGTFSFNSTGFWSVRTFTKLLNTTAADSAASCHLRITNDNSSYATAATTSVSLSTTMGRDQLVSETLIKVSDITLCKVQLQTVFANSNTKAQGSSTISYTYIVFEKKADL